MSKEQDEFSQLMDATFDGDQRAYQTLLQKVLPLARAYVQKRINNSSQVEDVAQEILISLHQARATFEKGQPFKPWFYAICRYRTLDHLRKIYRHAEHETALELDTIADTSAEDVTESIHGHELISKALAKLNKKQQRIVVLMKVEGYSASEVAHKMDMNVSAVKVSAHRAYKKMRDFLEKTQ